MFKQNSFKIIDDGKTVSIFLKSNLCAYVDLDDWNNNLKSHRWYYYRDRRGRRGVFTYLNKSKVFIQTMLLKPVKYERVIHLNSNKLDNRRTNLGKISLNHRNKFKILDDRKTVKVELNYGYYTYVDLDIWKKLYKYTWGVHHIPTKPDFKYVRTVVKMANGKQKCMLMHRLVFGARIREEVIHIDSDNFNNRKSNLTSVKGRFSTGRLNSPNWQ